MQVIVNRRIKNDYEKIATFLYRKLLEPVDFYKSLARSYLGFYNFSNAADMKNSENLLLIRDLRITTTCMIEALRLFDHYRFRVAQQKAKKAKNSWPW